MIETRITDAAVLLRHAPYRAAIRELKGRRYTAALTDVATRAAVVAAAEVLGRRAERAAMRTRPDPLLGLPDRLRERLRHRRLAAIHATMPQLARLYRMYAGAMTVVLAPTPHVAVQTTTKYVAGRRGFGRVVDGQHTTVRFQPDWAAAVHDRGLAVLDGKLTTHATKVAGRAIREAGSGVEVYRAAWVRQGRGYELWAEEGHIAIHRETGRCFHLGDRAVENPAVAVDRAARTLGRRLRAEARAADRRMAAIG